ncbi:hypothetical protein NTGBS_500086 [Candidatus Nitrotoga sp. BS]|nr:hypothetical protein NTGBS_500086 [Candidatus Nitrotoga sp. BS]
MSVAQSLAFASDFGGLNVHKSLRDFIAHPAFIATSSRPFVLSLSKDERGS